jgi:hypothetical protein
MNLLVGILVVSIIELIRTSIIEFVGWHFGCMNY